jgi:hypothetical protein
MLKNRAPSLRTALTLATAAVSIVLAACGGAAIEASPQHQDSQSAGAGEPSGATPPPSVTTTAPADRSTLAPPDSPPTITVQGEPSTVADSRPLDYAEKSLQAAAGAMRVLSIASAAADVGFPVAGLSDSTPSRITVLPTSASNPDGGVVAIAYDTSPLGVVQVWEFERGMSQAEIDSWADRHCTTCAFAERITLPDGGRGVLLGTPNDITAVHWIHPGGPQVSVFGPYDTFTRAAAIKAADDVAASLLKTSATVQ